MNIDTNRIKAAVSRDVELLTPQELKVLAYKFEMAATAYPSLTPVELIPSILSKLNQREIEWLFTMQVMNMFKERDIVGELLEPHLN